MPLKQAIVCYKSSYVVWTLQFEDWPELSHPGSTVGQLAAMGAEKLLRQSCQRVKNLI